MLVFIENYRIIGDSLGVVRYGENEDLGVRLYGFEFFLLEV